MNSPADLALANERLAGLVGMELLQFWMGGSLWLVFDTDPEVWIEIETPLTVVSGDGVWSGEPLSADAAGALLPLVFHEVTRAWMSGAGTLELGFGQIAVQVPPDADHESWHLKSPASGDIDCTPGGDVACWP